jgi:hypothetical protein
MKTSTMTSLSGLVATLIIAAATANAQTVTPEIPRPRPEEFRMFVQVAVTSNREHTRGYILQCRESDLATEPERWHNCRGWKNWETGPDWVVPMANIVPINFTNLDDTEENIRQFRALDGEEL